MDGLQISLKKFTPKNSRWKFVVLAMLLAYGLLTVGWVSAEPTSTDRAASAAKQAEYSSKHVTLHTDLTAGAAGELLGELEQLIINLGSYWGRPLSGRIECFVVADLKNWPTENLDVEGRAKIGQRAGITLTKKTTLDGQVTNIQSTVYAVADGRTPQHEMVHAFCWETFQRCGPDWLAEGMAEVGAYWKCDGKIHAPEWMQTYLREAGEVKPAEIIGGRLETREKWQTYAHQWALCHVLVHEGRYAKRFRDWSRMVLEDKAQGFEKELGDVEGELATDYGRFVQGLEK